MRNARLLTLVMLMLGACSPKKGPNLAPSSSGGPAPESSPPSQNSKADLGLRSDQEGRGGGGIVRYGQVLTFGSAQIQVREQALEEVPGLKRLHQGVHALGLASWMTGTLYEAYIPYEGNGTLSDSRRRYFAVKDPHFDEAMEARLIAEYQKLTNNRVPTTDLTLLAITVGRETYLLPKFFEVKNGEIGQAAVLWHEMEWVLKPKLDYATVVEGEMAFQHFLENPQPYRPEMMRNLKTLFGSYRGDWIRMAAKQDFSKPETTILVPCDNGDLNCTKTETVRDGKLSLRQIFGTEFIDFHSKQNSENPFLYSLNDLGPNDPDAWNRYLIWMSQANPELMTFRELYAQREALRLFGRFQDVAVDDVMVDLRGTGGAIEVQRPAKSFSEGFYVAKVHLAYGALGQLKQDIVVHREKSSDLVFKDYVGFGTTPDILKNLNN